MRHYRQLTDEDRIEIYAMKQAGLRQNVIAQRLKMAPSTISRELRRNHGLRGYRPKQAHALAQGRRQGARKALKMTPSAIAYIENRLHQEHAPEQIAATMAADPRGPGYKISHERIYQHIWQDKAAGGTLYRHLRIAGHQKKRKRYRGRDLRGQIPHRVGIEARPAVVEKRTRIGDWEVDTIIGGHHQAALVSLVERKSRFTLLGHVRYRTAEKVTDQIITLLQGQPHPVHTLTADNGREFAWHQQISAALKAAFYFAQPFAAWQRGLNENTNGLIRQYFPKGADLRQVSEQELQMVMDRLNHRPRKSLGFKTPFQVMYPPRKGSPVALVS